MLENDKEIICIEAQYKVCKLLEAELLAEMSAEMKAQEDQLPKKAEQRQQGEKNEEDEAGPSSERCTSSCEAEDFEHVEVPGDVEM